MENLPTEMQERMFINIHPVELVRLRLVSKSWYNILNAHLRGSIIFKKWCQKDLSIKPWIDQVLEKIDSLKDKSQWRSSPEDYWKKIFFSYQRWRMCFYDISKDKFRIRNLLPVKEDPENRIKSIDILEKYFLIGTISGFRLYKIKEKNFVHLFSHFPQDEINAVEPVKIWITKTAKLITVVTIKNNINSLEFWDFQKQQRISSFDVPLIFQFTCDENNRLFSGHHSEITIWRWDLQQSIIIKDATINIQSGMGFNVFGNSIITVQVSISDSREVQISEAIQSETFSQNYEIKKPHTRRFRCPITRCCIPLNNVILMSDRTILRAVVKSSESQEWKWYSRRIRGLNRDVDTITSILFHANVIILGTQQGHLLVQNVGDIQDLINPSYKFSNIRKIKVFRQEIISLSISQVHETNYVIVTTSRSVHVLEFKECISKEIFQDIDVALV